MGFLFFSCCLSAVVVCLLYGGIDDKPMWRLILAWMVGVFALDTLATAFILFAYGDWDDPTSDFLGQHLEPVVGMATITLSLVLGLFLRRRMIGFSVLVSLPLLVWRWSFAF